MVKVKKGWGAPSLDGESSRVAELEQRIAIEMAAQDLQEYRLVVGRWRMRAKRSPSAPIIQTAF
jgi:hypothetical protein